MPFEQGVRRRPTLVNNVETLAHVALIARHGARWFRQLGTPTQPGSALVTLSGPVAHPGVYEIEHGASLSSLIDAAGGSTAALRGALLGGYAGAWVGGELLRRRRPVRRTPRRARRLARRRASCCCSPSDACPVAETARVARWLAGQSARQCGPCVHGLDALAEHASRRSPRAPPPPQATQRIERLASLVARRGACGASRRRGQLHPQRAGDVRGGVRRPRAPRPVRGLRAARRAAAARAARAPGRARTLASSA